MDLKERRAPLVAQVPKVLQVHQERRAIKAKQVRCHMACWLVCKTSRID